VFNSKVNFASNTGTLLKPDSRIILVTPVGKEKEAILRLARVGYENVIGYLEGGVETWTKAGNELEAWKNIDPAEFKKILHEKPHILDIRNKGEWLETGVIEGAQLIAMGEVNSRINEIPHDKPVYVHCKLGGRSYLTYTLLRAMGVDAIDVKQGQSVFAANGIELKPPVL